MARANLFHHGRERPNKARRMCRFASLAIGACASGASGADFPMDADWVGPILSEVADEVGPILSEAADEVGPIFSEAADEAGSIFSEAADEAGPILFLFVVDFTVESSFPQQLFVGT